MPKVRFCFDIGQARQVDPTLGAALEMLRAFGGRLAEIPISEAGAASSHVALSRPGAPSYRRLASRLPPTIPAIIESVIGPGALAEELATARFALGDVPRATAARQQANDSCLAKRRRLTGRPTAQAKESHRFA
jgi:hypothetical protein